MAAWQVLARLESFQDIWKEASAFPSQLLLRREVLAPNKPGGGARSRFPCLAFHAPALDDDDDDLKPWRSGFPLLPQRTSAGRKRFKRSC